MAKDLRKYAKPGAQGRGYGGNPGGHRGGHRPPTKKGCCSMVAAGQAAREGKFRLARRYGRVTVRVLAQRATFRPVSVWS